jgi:DNA-binding response OmpR family regulator
MRILIVEDEKSLVDIIKKGLEEEGYAVDVAYNGTERIKCFPPLRQKSSYSTWLSCL